MGVLVRCIGCGKCKDTGHCVFNADHVNEAIDLLREADGTLWVLLCTTPAPMAAYAPS